MDRCYLSIDRMLNSVAAADEASSGKHAIVEIAQLEQASATITAAAASCAL
jgi:hypothetical protein